MTASGFGWGLLTLWASAAGCRASCGGEPGEQPGGALDLVRRVRAPADVRPVAADIDDAGSAFLAAGMRGPVYVWTAIDADAAAAATLPISGAVAAARFLEGDHVFVGLEEGPAAIWAWRQTMALFEHRFVGHSAHVAASADGRLLAFGGEVFDTKGAKEVGRARALATQSALAFATAGNRVVIAGFQEPRIVVRDLPEGTTREWFAPGKVRTASLDGRGELVAAALDDGRIHTWGQPGGDERSSWTGPDGILGMRFVRGDSHLVVVHAAGITLYRLPEGERVLHAGVDGKLWTFAVDGDFVAAGTTTGVVMLWDLARSVRVAREKMSTSVVTAVGIKAVRRLVVTADEANEVALWRWR